MEIELLALVMQPPLLLMAYKFDVLWNGTTVHVVVDRLHIWLWKA